MVARRILAAALVAVPTLVTGATTLAVMQESGPVLVDFERHYEQAFIQGFHSRESMDGRGFRWTTADARIRVTNLPRRSRLRIEVRVKGLRPRGVPLPRIRFSANGVTVYETLCAPGLVTYRFGVTLPDSSLELGIHPDVFVPSRLGRETRGFWAFRFSPCGLSHRTGSRWPRFLPAG